MTHTAQAALYQASSAQPTSSIGDAWRQLGSAFVQLLKAAVQSWRTTFAAVPVDSAQQEADKLREYADTLFRTDPRFAQDLYAAASRHEDAVRRASLSN